MHSCISPLLCHFCCSLSGVGVAEAKNYATAAAAVQQLLTHAASGHCCMANTTADNGWQRNGWPKWYHTHTYPNPNPRIPAFLTVLMAAPQQHINAIEIWLHAILTLRSTRTLIHAHSHTHTDRFAERERGVLEKVGKGNGNTAHILPNLWLYFNIMSNAICPVSVSISISIYVSFWNAAQKVKNLEHFCEYWIWFIYFFLHSAAKWFIITPVRPMLLLNSVVA